MKILYESNCQWYFGLMWVDNKGLEQLFGFIHQLTVKMSSFYVNCNLSTALCLIGVQIFTSLDQNFLIGGLVQFEFWGRICCWLVRVSLHENDRYTKPTVTSDPQ